MPIKLKNNLYYLSSILIAISVIVLFRLLKVYDIFCTIAKISAPILFGFIFAWILYPIYKKLNQTCSKLVSLGILIIVFLLFYTILILKLVPILIENFKNLFALFDEYIEKLSKIEILKDLKDYSTLDVEFLISSCGSLASSLSTVFLIHLFGFYILYNYEMVVSFVKSLIPKKYRTSTLSYVKKLSSNMRAYIKGTLLDMVFLFIFSFILYLLIGLEYPAFLALFAATTNIIPFIGPYIGGLIAVLVALKSSLRKAFFTLGALVVAQTVESNIVNPMIMSKCIKINPLLIIIAITIMGHFGGLLGMIFAVPVLIVLKLTIEYIGKNYPLKLKILIKDTP